MWSEYMVCIMKFWKKKFLKYIKYNKNEPPSKTMSETCD